MWCRASPLLVLLLLAACGSPPSRPIRETSPALAWPDLGARGGPAIWAQLRQYESRPDLCRRALAAQPGWTIEPVADTSPSPGCGLRKAIRIIEAPIGFNRPQDMSCPLAAGLHLWMRDSITPAARLYLDSTVVRIESFGTYACRTRNNRPGARLSEHATANAIDISAFVLADGRRLRILDLPKLKEDERDFIQSVRKSACRTTSVVLGPGSDGYHEDHLHLDLGPWRACR
jgi:hypothetical protein